jgi:ABC-type polar amino acid transport system ATPase subunit
MSTPVLEIIDLRKSFGETLVLHDVNLTVPEHTATVLIGASGSVKSTLLLCAPMLLNSDSTLLKANDAFQLLFLFWFFACAPVFN